jgi:hypothetical protein
MPSDASHPQRHEPQPTQRLLADHKRIGFSAFLTQAPPPTQPERYDETRRFQRVKRAREDSNL